MSDDSGRAQDQGRRHRRAKGQPSAATSTLLAEYQEAMRTELRTILSDLRGKMPAPGLGLVQQEPVRPPLGERMKLWDLAIKLGRELGTEVDVAPSASPGAPTPIRRRKVDYG